jgi:dTDP-4-dehydrorhamnose reductase
MSFIFDNVLIFGSNGMIGKNLDYGIRPLLSDVDITSLKSIENYLRTLDNRVSCIINLAFLNLRDSENNIEKSIDVNINGTTNLLQYAKKLNIPFVLLSTGAVFSSNNNSNQIFNENTETNPNCVYGYTKSSAEKIALLYEKSIVIRTGWVFGGTQKSHYKYVEYFINNFLTNTEIYANNNFYGSPTYVKDLIEKMKFIIINNKYGIHPVVNSGIATGYDVALEIANLMEKDTKLIIPVECDKIPNAGPKRSISEILESEFEINKMRNWKEALKEYVNKYLQEKRILNTANIKNKNEKNEIWKNREKCRLCNSFELDVFINLEPTPQANHYVKIPIKQESIPLDVCICNKCKHIQLLQILNPSFQYSNYLYVTSASKTMVNHVINSVQQFLDKFNIQKTDNILEIGANDGTCINYLIEAGYNNSVGVDPAENINNNHSLPIICDFFGSNILKNKKIKKKSYKLIFAFHCCAHIENIQDVFYTIQELLTDDGIFIMEVGYFYEVYKNKLFDTIYHEHIDYHTCKAMKTFCSNNNLVLFDVKINKIQSGSIQFYISKDTNIIPNKSVNEFVDLEENIKLSDLSNLYKWKISISLNSRDLQYILTSFINQGKTIFGYGASAKSTTFTHQFKLSNSLIKYIIDDSYLKQNLYSPGYNIPIVSIDILNKEKCDYLIILSWNFLDDILVKVDEYRKRGLRVIVPFPHIQII